MTNVQTKKTPLLRITPQRYEETYGKDTVAELFVINTTSKPFGNVCINVIGETGKSEAIFIPNTRLPIDITTEVHASVILRSAEFRRMIKTGKLAIVSNESVMKYMASNPHARTEYAERFKAEWFDIYGDSDELDGDDSSSNELDVDDLYDGGSNESATGQNEVTYPQAEQILLLEKEAESRAVSNLNSIGLDLSIAELQYILNNCTTNSVKDLTSELIQDLSED